MKTINDADTKKNIKILKAARGVFTKHGYKKVVIEDIARELDMTRSALYYYYQNKRELFLSMLDYELGLYRLKLEEAISSASTTEEKFTVFGNGAVRLRNKFVNVYKISFEEIFTSYQEARAFKDKIYSLHATTIAGIVKLDRDIPVGTDPEYYGRLLAMSIRGVIFSAAGKSDRFLKKNLEEVCKIFYHGLYC